MAMLAEPRRKQRIGPNPRGKFFTEDDDNRGRQMLVKMGWKTGDGLGATSQGMSEPIKPKINSDSKGLGFDRKKDAWVAHNEDFEQLLKNLNNSAAEDAPPSKELPDDDDSSNSANEGLAEKSKRSRSRIHYHKFVKNKDLSRASTKDMSCIFGKAVDETVTVITEEIPTVKKKKKKRPVENVEENEKESELTNQPDLTEENITVKKKKKKHPVENVEEESELTNQPDLTEENITVKKNKKKKKHPVENVEEKSEPTNQPDFTEEITAVKKKKKKRPVENLEEESELTNQPDLTEENITVKKNKKKKHPVENVEEKSEPTNQPDFTEEITTVKKKKKRKKNPVENVEEESEPTNQPEDVSNVDDSRKTNESDKVEKFGSLQFINRGSIVDYFRSKMQNRGLSSGVIM